MQTKSLSMLVTKNTNYIIVGILSTPDQLILGMGADGLEFLQFFKGCCKAELFSHSCHEYGEVLRWSLDWNSESLSVLLAWTSWYWTYRGHCTSIGTHRNVQRYLLMNIWYFHLNKSRWKWWKFSFYLLATYDFQDCFV